MILLLLLAMQHHHADAKHPVHHAKVVCHVYATKGPFKDIKDCK